MTFYSADGFQAIAKHVVAQDLGQANSDTTSETPLFHHRQQYQLKCHQPSTIHLSNRSWKQNTVQVSFVAAHLLYLFLRFPLYLAILTYNSRFNKIDEFISGKVDGDFQSLCLLLSGASLRSIPRNSAKKKENAAFLLCGEAHRVFLLPSFKERQQY